MKFVKLYVKWMKNSKYLKNLNVSVEKYGLNIVIFSFI